MEGESSKRWGKLREFKQKLKVKRKSSKECEKLLKKAASEDGGGITFISPFKHTIHVDHDFTWSGESVDSFTMDKLLGEGSYGSVYKSLSPGGKVVAIKKVIFDTDDTESSYSDYNTDSDMSIIDDGNLSDNTDNDEDEMMMMKQKPPKQQQANNNILTSSSKLKREEMRDLVFEMERKKISKEIELLKQLDSKYIVQYYGSMWKSKKELWIIMEYCKFGSSLFIILYHHHHIIND
jgi:serine/threonine protein kinase